MLVSALLLPPLASPLSAGFPAAPAADCAGAGSNDFDGDGVDDTVVGDPFAAPGGHGGAGAVHLLFGKGERGKVVSAPSPEAGEGFGWSVKLTRLDADRCADLLIGAPYADVAGQRDAGAVYAVYGGAERKPVRLVSSTPEADAHFGWSLASDGAVIAVGAPHEDADGVEDAGAVHLFDSGSLAGERRISQDTEGVPGSSEVGDMFGWSLAVGRLGGALDEPDLAVGAPYDNDDGRGRQSGEGKRDAGSIAVLFDVREPKQEYAAKDWDLHEIVPTDAGDRLGYAMAYGQEGDVGYLAVSAPLGDGGQVKDSGLVRLFRASGTEEVAPLATLDQGADGAAGEGYGFSLAFTGEGGTRLAVGVPFDGPDQRGGVRLVPVRDPARAQLVALGGAGDHFGWSVAFSGNRLVVGAPDHGRSGAVALLGRNDGTGTLLSPGTGEVPALSEGDSADFGATVG
ncbi:hypothetical protein GCM10017600_49540 [Streptosporangium carneum]|uniref:Integrin n=1 Tax=Streptosporangium carneum TaxID=47481 RepID=A0A9W6MEW4_9ACTN|nr:hypothetical protein GCM10017600_49540 [Streptosporangium carneum]